MTTLATALRAAARLPGAILRDLATWAADALDRADTRLADALNDPKDDL